MTVREWWGREAGEVFVPWNGRAVRATYVGGGRVWLNGDLAPWQPPKIEGVRLADGARLPRRGRRV